MAEVTRDALRRLVDEVVTLADESDEPAVKLSRVVLRDAADAAMREPNTRRMADLSFALTDLRSAIDELPFSERATFAQPVGELNDLVEELCKRTSLSGSLLEHIRYLSERLEQRRAAVARQGFHPPGSTPPPLPHAPADLQREAIEIRDALRASGFETPALDQLVEQPDSVYMSELAAIVNELEVITG